MKKVFIVLLIFLFSTSFLLVQIGAQGLRSDGLRVKKNITVHDGDFSGDVEIDGKFVVDDSMRVNGTSLFKGDATFQADILMTGTVSETLEVIGTAPTILMVDNDDASSDTLSITMVDSIAQFDGSTFVIDTENNRVGIGTTGPANALDVVVNSAGASVIRVQNTNVAGYSILDFYDNSGTSQLSLGYGNPSVNALYRRTFLGSPSDIAFISGSNVNVMFKSTGDVGIGTVVPKASSLTLGTKGNQRDLLVTRENVPAATDSSLLVTISSGNPQIAFKASDADASEITVNTSDQMVFQNAGGGYTFDANVTAPHFIGVADSQWNTINLGSDAENASGQLNFIASDNDQGNIAINTSDQLVFTDFGGGIDADGNYIKNAKLEYSLAQGVRWNQGASSSVLTRLGSLTGITVSVSAGDSVLPVQSSMKRCLLNDDGTVNYYLNPDSSFMKQYTTATVTGTATTNTANHLVDTGADFVTDGVVVGMYAHNVTDDYYSLITAVAATDLTLRIDAFPDGNEGYVIGNADLDGTDGQVMVEISKFYIKHILTGAVHDWYISKYHLPGFSVHPFFLKDGVEVDHRYVGAYEACIWDNSAGVYLGGETDIVDTAADKLASVVGTKPHTNETRAEYRSIAENRGQGWHQYDSWAHAALQLLYIIEYANFNSQTVIGTGNTSYKAWNYANNVGYCGYSNPDGNGTNASTTAEDGLEITDPNDGITNREYMSYRGVENFYGSVWQWIDGINVDTNREVYLCYMYSNYTDDTSTDYEDIGTLATSDGYINNILDYSFGFLPSGYSGDLSTYLCDYYYQASGAWRVVRVGGNASYGVTAGVFDFAADNASSVNAATISARILY